MLLYFIIYLLVIILFASLIVYLFIARYKNQTKDRTKSIKESKEYIKNTKKFFKNANSEDDEGDDIRDIYNKKTPKHKKKGYTPKSYRGTDIEIAGFENPNDLKALKKDDLNTIDTEDLEKEVAIKNSNEIKKPVEAPKPDPSTFKSGIANKKSAMAKMILEIKENYNAAGHVSALDNFDNSPERGGGRGI